MPWFGIQEHWAGSMCLMHHVTKFPWPHESREACGAFAANFDWAKITNGTAATSRWEDVAFDEWPTELREPTEVHA